jgi:iron(III) transport system substrate-binding protein
VASGDINSMNTYKARNVTQAYKPAGWDKVPNDMKDPDGYWTAFVLVGVYLFYNTNGVSSDVAPTSWQDLQKPMWKDKLVLSDPAVSGSAAALAGALVQKYGWRYWEEVAKNSPRVLPTTVSLTTSIATGDRAVGFITAQPGLSEIKKGSPVKLVVPSDGVPFTHIIASISAHTQQVAAARTLVEYLLSSECAALLVSANRQPARLDAPPVPGLPSLADTPRLALDWKQFETQKADLSDNFHRIIASGRR